MIYIAGRRNVNRVKPLVDVQVFSNVEEVILIVNDCQCGKMKPDSLKVCLFKDVPLRKGRNEIEVRANDSKKTIDRSMCLDITIKQLPQGVIHLFLRRLFFISLI